MKKFQCIELTKRVRLQVPDVPAIATVMAGVSERTIQQGESHPVIELAGLSHLLRRFEIAFLKVPFFCFGQAQREKLTSFSSIHRCLRRRP